MKLLLITILIIMVTVDYFAQENEYTVLTKSGEVFVIHKITSDQSDIAIGDKLKPHERIQLSKNGYVVLVDTSLQSIELSKEGVYNVIALDTVFNMKRNSITEKITQFILDEMSTSGTRTDEMKTLGAVVRKPINKIEVAIPKIGKIIDTIYTFQWHPVMDSSAYIFRLFNTQGSTIYMEETSDTAITLNLSKINLNYENNYFWTVFDRTVESIEIDSVSFSLLSPKDAAVLEKQLIDIKRDMIIEDSPLNYLLVARFLKNEGLNELAIKYFKKSIEANPNLEFYWGEYINFLLENDLTYEALQNWNNSPFSKEEKEDEE